MENQIQTERIIDPITNKMEHIKYQKDYLAATSQFQKLYHEYVTAVGKLMKTIMKNTAKCPNATDEVFRFFGAAIRGNVNRTRLAAQLENEPEHLKSYASDSFSMVLFDVLIELVKPILQKDALLEKIDMNFLDNLCSEFQFEDLDFFTKGSKYVEPTLKNPNNISKFFFYLVTCVHYHYIQVSNKYMKENENFRRYEKEAAKMSPSNKKYALYQEKLRYLKKKLIVYRLMISDSERNYSLQKVFNHL